jgi:hypothetical protein
MSLQKNFFKNFKPQFLHALACGRRLVEQSIGVYFFYLITVLLLFLYNESKASTLSLPTISTMQSPSRTQFLFALVTAILSSETVTAFAPSAAIAFAPRSTQLWSCPSADTDATTDASTTPAPAVGNFIGTEMRAAAMKLHTFVQSPKEGKTAPAKQEGPKYVPTHADYLAFLVNSQHVYQALEEIVNNDKNPELAVFRNTGLERVTALEQDIAYMTAEYGLTRPEPGSAGKGYAQKLRDISATSIPEFVCHFYNFSFAHTAGGRMIGKQMSALLLDKKTLEFYKVRNDMIYEYVRTGWIIWHGSANEHDHILSFCCAMHVCRQVSVLILTRDFVFITLLTQLTVGWGSQRNQSQH